VKGGARRKKKKGREGGGGGRKKRQRHVTNPSLLSILGSREGGVKGKMKENKLSEVPPFVFFTHFQQKRGKGKKRKKGGKGGRGPVFARSPKFCFVVFLSSRREKKEKRRRKGKKGGGRRKRDRSFSPFLVLTYWEKGEQKMKEKK